MQASFGSQRCSQAPKLDRISIRELTVPLFAPAQVKLGETLEEGANSGKESFIGHHQMVCLSDSSFQPR